MSNNTYDIGNFCLRITKYDFDLRIIRGNLVVSTPAYQAAGRGFDPCSDQACYIRCKNLALCIIDCVDIYVPFGGDTKIRRSFLSGVYTGGSNMSHTGGKCVTCRGVHILA